MTKRKWMTSYSMYITFFGFFTHTCDMITCKHFTVRIGQFFTHATNTLYKTLTHVPSTKQYKSKITEVSVSNTWKINGLHTRSRLGHWSLHGSCNWHYSSCAIWYCDITWKLRSEYILITACIQQLPFMLSVYTSTIRSNCIRHVWFNTKYTNCKTTSYN